MENSIEFMFNGCPVRVLVQAKAVVVNFVGRPLQFSATGAVLRERVRAELKKAGLGVQMEKALSREWKSTKR